ncbi:MAG: O-antigen ligase family protein, partial [Thermodesulfobacteriota bacterium]
MIFYKPYLGIVFVIISIPFEGSINPSEISIYPLEVILVILISVCIYKLIMGTANYFRNTKLVFYYLPFMLCILLSSLKFMELSLTIKEIVRWLELIAVYFLTINLITDYKRMMVILYSMVLTAVVIAIWGVIGYSGGAITIDGRHGAYSFFGHPNALAGYVNLIIPVLFSMLMMCTLLWKRITLGCSIMLMIATWFLTFSKSGWLSLIITLLLVSLLAKAKKRMVFILAILTISSVIAFLSSNVRNDLVDRLQSTYKTIEYRRMSYPVGFNMVRDDLFYGIGVGNYPLLIKEFADASKTPYLIKTNLHNLYLQIFVEAGILGICAFVFWLTGIIKYLMSALKSLEKYRDNGLFVGLVGGVIVYLFGNLADVLAVHGIHLQWGIILGLAVVLT